MLSKLAIFLKKQYPETAKNIFWALMYFPEVRDSLENPGLLRYIESKYGEPHSWRLGQLAACALDYQTNVDKSKISTPLTDAGLIVNSFLETLEDDRWDEILGSLQTYIYRNLDQNSSHFQIVCLSGFLEDPYKLAERLLNSSSSPSVIKLAVLILCCNYFDNSVLNNLLFSLLNALPPAYRIPALDFLHQTGKKALVLSLAKKFVDEIDDAGNISEKSNKSSSFLISNRLYEMSLWRFLQDEKKYTDSIKNLEKQFHSLQQGLLIYSLETAADEDAFRSVQRDIVDISLNEDQDFQTLFELSAAAYQRGFSPAVPGLESSPYTKIMALKKLLSIEPREICSELAQKAINQFEILIENDHICKTPEFIKDYGFNIVLKDLYEAGFIDHTIRFGELLRQNYPMDVEVIHYLAISYQQSGKSVEALHLTLQESGYDSDGYEIKKRLYGLYRELGCHVEAYDQFRDLNEIEQDVSENRKIELAELALLAGDYQKTVSVCMEITEQGIETAQVCRLMGEAQLRLIDFEQASHWLEKAVTLQPDEPGAYSLLVETNRNLDRSQENLALLERGLALLPESAAIRIAIAKEYLQDDLIAEGLPFLQDAASFPPDTRQAALDVGTLLNGMGDLEGALAYYQKALSVMGFDTEIARAALVNSRELDDYTVMGEIAGQLCRSFKPEADDYYFLLLSKMRGKSPILSENFVISTSDMEQIDELTERALSIDPDHFDINLMKAELLSYAGKYVEAKELIANIVDRDGQQNWKLAGVLGLISLNLGEYNTSVAAFQESYQHNPGNIMLERYLAEANLGAGLITDAKYYAEKVIRRSPNNLAVLLWYGDVIGKLGDHRSAVDAFIQANAMRPEDTEIMVRLLFALFNCGEFTQTREILERLGRNDPLSNEAINQLGRIYIYFNDWEKLTELIQDHLDAFQDQKAELLGSLSVVELKRGNIEKAFEYSQEILSIAPENLGWILYQADLLYQLGKTQAALSLVEHAEKVRNGDSPSVMDLENLIAKELFPSNWVSMASNGVGSAARKILFLRKLYKNQEAVFEASSAYEEYKDSLLCCMLVELYIEHGKFADALELLKSVSSHAEPMIREASYRLSTRLYILLDQQSDLETLLEKNEFYESHSSEAICAKAIQKWAEGDWVKANEYYLEAQAVFKEINLNEGTIFSQWGTGYDPIEELLRTKPFWVLETGCRLHEWDQAVKTYSKVYLENPDNLAIQYGFTKALVDAAKWDIYADLLNIQVHRLHSDELEFEVQSRIERMISSLTANRVCSYTTNLKLQADLLFSNKAVQFKELIEVLSLPEDLDLVTAILHRDRKHSQLKAIAERLGEMFQFEWKQALCFYGSDIENGMVLAENAARSNPNSPLAQISASIFAEAADNSSDAYGWVQIAINLWPDETAWRLAAARLASANDDITGAIANLEELIKISETNVVIAGDLASLYIQNAQFEEAIETLHSLEMKGIVGLDIYLLQGEAYYFLEEFDAAFEYAEKARVYDVKSAESYLLYARICEKLEQFDAAMSYARRALEFQPHDPDIHLFLGRILEKTGHPEEALQLVENLVIQNKAGGDVLLMFIRLKQKLFGSRSVLPLLEDLRKEIDFEERVLIDLTEAYFEVGEYEKAQREALEVLKIQPDQSRMKIILAKINQKKGQLDLAIHYCVDAIADAPKEIEGYLTLAEVYIGRREILDALGVYKQAIRVNPQNHLPYLRAGLLLRETKDYKEAEIMLKHAARLAPDELQIRRQLGAVVALNLVHNAQEEKIVI